MPSRLRAAALAAGCLALLPGCSRAQETAAKRPAAPPPPSASAPPARAPDPAPASAPTAPSSGDVTAQDYVGPALPRGKVVLTDAFGGRHPVDVEIAATHAARTRGLMWREQLPAGQGMLFVFGHDAPQSFWMRNTLIPLDMLFIDRERTVVGIVSRAEPRSLTARGVRTASRYVLEVPGGWAEEKGIRAGSKVELSGLQMLEVER